MTSRAACRRNLGPRIATAVPYPHSEPPPSRADIDLASASSPRQSIWTARKSCAADLDVAASARLDLRSHQGGRRAGQVHADRVDPEPEAAIQASSELLVGCVRPLGCALI